MEHNSIQNLSAPKCEFLEPPKSYKPITASGFEVHPGFIAMVREKSFSGSDIENPYPPPTRVRAAMFMSVSRRHGTRNNPVEVVSLLPNCNTRFIKGHKPSNHIRARIKSHVYTTE